MLQTDGWRYQIKLEDSPPSSHHAFFWSITMGDLYKSSYRAATHPGIKNSTNTFCFLVKSL